MCIGHVWSSYWGTNGSQIKPRKGFHRSFTRAKPPASCCFQLRTSKFFLEPQSFASKIWLVVEPPLWKIWKSLGMIILNTWKNNPNLPNHQPEIILNQDNPGVLLQEVPILAQDASKVSPWRTTVPRARLDLFSKTGRILCSVKMWF